jgi:hypothetical protein
MKQATLIAEKAVHQLPRYKSIELDRYSTRSFVSFLMVKHIATMSLTLMKLSWEETCSAEVW